MGDPCENTNARLYKAEHGFTMAEGHFAKPSSSLRSSRVSYFKPCKPMDNSVIIGWHHIGFLGGQHSSSSLASAFLMRDNKDFFGKSANARLYKAVRGFKMAEGHFAKPSFSLAARGSVFLNPLLAS